MNIKFILWNFFGLSIPLIIAILTVPKLLELIGAEGFGLLTLAWGLIGYAGVLDLGIGRATTQYISTLRGEGNHNQIPDVLASALRMTAITGTVGMIIIILAASSGVHLLIKVESTSATELGVSLLLLAIALPAQAISATYRGVNEAFLNFRKISTLRIVLGTANFGLPFFIALYTTQLHFLVSSIVISRIIALLFYRHYAHECLLINKIKNHGRYSPIYSKKLFTFGGWVTVSSILNPIFSQTDRFLISAIISSTAITYYVIPYEVVTQSLIIVGAITSVIFPVLSQSLKSDPYLAEKLFKKWLINVSAIMGISTLILCYILPDLLYIWLKQPISDESITSGRILCVGVFFNSIGSMYFTLLHAKGNTRITAIFHIIETPIFIVTLFTLLQSIGIIGAAIAWSLRMFIDLLLLIYASKKLTKTIC